MITSIKIPSQLQLILLMTRRKGAGPEEIVQPSNVLKLNTPSWLEHIFLHLPVPRHKCANLKAENVTEELFHPKAVPFKLCMLLRQHIFRWFPYICTFSFTNPLASLAWGGEPVHICTAALGNRTDVENSYNKCSVGATCTISIQNMFCMSRC